MSKIYARPLAMATLALTLAVGTAGCQTMADLDPTGLIGGDDSAPAPDTQFPPDSQQQAAQDANTTTPDLASLPARPAQPDAAAQAATTQSVTAAGTQAQYSADALRAGTDAAAPPPAATDAAATKQAMAAAAASAPPTADAPPTAGSADNSAPPTAEAPSAAPPTASSAPPTASAPAAAANPNAAVPAQQVASAAPPSAPEAAPPSAAAQPGSPAAAPVASAALAPPPGAAPTTAAMAPSGEPAVPAVPMTPGTQMAMVNPSDAQLGFKPSSAPPLNASVSQWVSPPVLAHYRETAAMAGSAGMGEPAVAAVPAVSGRHGRRGAAADTAAAGDVVANLDAVPGSPMGRVAAMNGGVPPTQIIYFPGDTTSLSKAALAKVRSAVEAFQANGGTGTVKVVGHASSRTANMPVEKHLEVIFQKSQARANAVAQALIRAGVPADKVQIEAVGDSQPIYYESMPKGEDGNRRAEIFVQG
ncbi:MAG TPA: OmpA family protein [Rhizomicrobium sp.]|nr:OmpA family protein [Rhizomicrobium sp.]